MPGFWDNPNMSGAMDITGMRQDSTLVFGMQWHPPHSWPDAGVSFGEHYKGPDGFHYFWNP